MPRLEDGGSRSLPKGRPVSAENGISRTRATLGRLLVLLLALGIDTFGTTDFVAASPAPDPAPSSGTPSEREVEVKATYLVTFPRYVEWPEEAFPSARDPVILGIFGQEALDSRPEDIASKRSQSGRAVVVRRFEDIDQAHDCHLVYFPEGSEVTEELLQALGAAHTLTVGEDEDFLALGGAIRLALINNRIGFLVNLPAVEEADLEISSRMLEVALEVIPSANRGRSRKP